MCYSLIVLIFHQFPYRFNLWSRCFQNYRRVAEVWMDEYAEYLYQRRPHYRSIDAGDLSEQRAIREKLKCKPFKWFMTEIAFDLPKYYPPVEPPAFAEGEVCILKLQLTMKKRCVVSFSWWEAKSWKETTLWLQKHPLTVINGRLSRKGHLCHNVFRMGL